MTLLEIVTKHRSGDLTDGQTKREMLSLGYSEDRVDLALAVLREPEDEIPPFKAFERWKKLTKKRREGKLSAKEYVTQCLIDPEIRALASLAG